MAKASLSAQHFLECDNCEENPAQFLCKTCTGHLCEPCKSKHESKKITKNHEIVALTSRNEEMLDLLVCPNHAKKKLECYCDRCEEPVCTDCIIESHNGHSVKSMSTAYKEFKEYSKQKKEKIENDLLPSHMAMLAKEKEKRSAFTKRADDIEKKIDAHTLSVVEMVKHIGQQTVESLRKSKKEGLKEMDIFKDNLEEKIKQLHQFNKQISENLEAKPQPSIFKSTRRSNEVERFGKLPSPTEYTLTDFEPQKMKEINFGKPPLLQSSTNTDREKSSSHKVKFDVNRHRRSGLREVDIKDEKSSSCKSKGDGETEEELREEEKRLILQKARAVVDQAKKTILETQTSLKKHKN